MEIPQLNSVVEALRSKGLKDSLYDLLRIEEERGICKAVDLSGIQDAGQVRYRFRAHLLANTLIDEKGILEQKQLEAITVAWEKGGRIFYSDPASDESAYLHVQKMLRWFLENESARKQLLKFSLPLANSYLENLVKIALFLPYSQKLTTADVRRAVLSCCLCFLRQSVGSCFATAPAILIHEERPENFLLDLEEILFTGRLKRVVEGVEYAVPCSPSWGIGDLKKDLVFLHHHKNPSLSVGLLRGLEAAGIPPSRISELGKKKSPLFIDEFFEQEILEKLQVKKNAWENFKKPHPHFPRELLLQRQSAEEVACEKAKQALQSAKDAFRAVADHPLLKTWEYTLASFSEVKMEFSRWNLYASLGLDPKEEFGIGSILREEIERILNQANKKVEELHQEYSVAFDQVRATEAVLRNVSSEQEARRLSAEYQAKIYQMQNLLEMRNEAHRKSSGYASLLSFLVQEYHARFPDYFQEIYDPELFDPKIGLYQDSAAGFRLVYKHGRNDPSLWTIIRNSEEYIDALADFFKMSEPQIIDACKEESAAKEIPRLTDKIISHLHTEEFLGSALKRMEQAHTPQKLPGQALEMLSGEKKPWAYISGGTMDILLKTYFRSPSKIHQEGRWVESAEDLLILLLETLKGISFPAAEQFRRDPQKRLLMHSPTHAFSLLPGLPDFCEGWSRDSFTYTWVRDQLLVPSQRFFEEIVLESEEVDYLYRALEIEPPRSVKKMPLEKFLSAMDPMNWDELDALLFRHLPFLPRQQWKLYASKVVPMSFVEFPDHFPTVLSSQELMKTAKACHLLSHGSLQLNVDLHEMVLKNAIASGLAAPRIVFADTNWPHYYFAFAWGAASNRLRLFRIDPSGQKAEVMTMWESYLTGSERLQWLVFSRLEQYS